MILQCGTLTLITCVIYTAFPPIKPPNFFISSTVTLPTQLMYTYLKQHVKELSLGFYLKMNSMLKTIIEIATSKQYKRFRKYLIISPDLELEKKLNNLKFIRAISEVN